MQTRALTETRTALQIATLFHGRAALEPDRAWMSTDTAGDRLADTRGAASTDGARVRRSW